MSARAAGAGGGRRWLAGCGVAWRARQPPSTTRVTTPSLTRRPEDNAAITPVISASSADFIEGLVGVGCGVWVWGWGCEINALALQVPVQGRARSHDRAKGRACGAAERSVVMSTAGRACPLVRATSRPAHMRTRPRLYAPVPPAWHPPPPRLALSPRPTQVKDAEEKGGALLTGAFRREQNLLWPCVVDRVTPDMRLAWEEVRMWYIQGCPPTAAALRPLPCGRSPPRSRSPSVTQGCPRPPAPRPPGCSPLARCCQSCGWRARRLLWSIATPTASRCRCAWLRRLGADGADRLVASARGRLAAGPRAAPR